MHNEETDFSKTSKCFFQKLNFLWNIDIEKYNLKLVLESEIARKNEMNLLWKLIPYETYICLFSMNFSITIWASSARKEEGRKVTVMSTKFVILGRTLREASPGRGSTHGIPARLPRTICRFDELVCASGFFEILTAGATLRSLITAGAMIVMGWSTDTYLKSPRTNV